MKAFLLAAGLGTRLRPLTDTMPKCLVPVRGKPLLEWWFELFKKYGINEVLVNTYYMAEQVEEFIHGYEERHNGIKITIYHENELMGSAGTVYANRGFIGADEDFFICYADNLTDLNLAEMLAQHHRYRPVLTMALFRTDTPKQCGIATVEKSGLITDFTEKPQEPESNLANAGIYVAGRELYSYLEGGACRDFGKDVLPKLVGKMHGYEINAYLRDIGTIHGLQMAREEWIYDNI